MTGRFETTNPKKTTGDIRKQAGAGPALAAHSKDAKSDAKSGQNSAATKKK